MLFGSGQAQAGRIRVLAAGMRLRRDARVLVRSTSKRSAPPEPAPT